MAARIRSPGGRRTVAGSPCRLLSRRSCCSTPRPARCGGWPRGCTADWSPTRRGTRPGHAGRRSRGRRRGGRRHALACLAGEWVPTRADGIPVLRMGTDRSTGRRMAAGSSMSRWPDPDGPLDARPRRRRLRRRHPAGHARRSWQLRGGWAPDSRNVVYAPYFERSVSDRFWVVDTESAATSEVVDPSGVVIDPVWSPDGAWIAYCRARPTVVSWSLHPDETGRRTMAQDWTWATSSAGGPTPPPSPTRGSRTSRSYESCTSSRSPMGPIGSSPSRDQPGDVAWANSTRDQAGVVVPDGAAAPATTAPPELPVATPPAGEPLEPDATWGRMVVRCRTAIAIADLAIIRFPGEVVRSSRGG